jgi:Fis family transcriptional regulator
MGTLDLMDRTLGLESKGELETVVGLERRGGLGLEGEGLERKGGLEKMVEKPTELNQESLLPPSSFNQGHTTTSERPTLSKYVRESVERYISAMDDQNIEDLYELVISEVEAPLLESVLNLTHNNQSKTATILGLNRGTLRKKLRKYGML